MTDANYDCFYGYDERGNINSILRYGFKGLSSAGVPEYDVIDNLTFTSEGANMVSGVEDSADPLRGFLGTEAEYVNHYGRYDITFRVSDPSYLNPKKSGRFFAALVKAAKFRLSPLFAYPLLDGFNNSFIRVS